MSYFIKLCQMLCIYYPAEILAGIPPEDVRATARTLRLIKDNLLKMAGGKLADAE